MTDFSHTKSLFFLPDNIVYLDGNSLGPLPVAAQQRLAKTARDEWGEMLIKGWNDAGWFSMPTTMGERIAKLLGAPAKSIVMGDTLSLKVYQALAAALNLANEKDPARRIILSDTGNFPTDLYMARGLIDTMDKGYLLKLADPFDILGELDETIAVLMLTHIDYRTGRMHDMNNITKLAHQKGITVIWDLAHSAGAVSVDLKAANADFAVGCTYKFLNGGPGSPAFIYVAPQHIDDIKPALSGWLGHDAPFAFDLDYRAGEKIERMRVGTPPILQFAALDAALDVWDHVDMEEVRKKSIELSELFINLVETNCPQLTLASPRDPARRGSQVSFNFDEGYAAMQAIIGHGVIGDFRSPDIMRFAITPLYIDENDIQKGANIITDVINSGIWQEAKYQSRQAVT